MLTNRKLFRFAELCIEYVVPCSPRVARLFATNDIGEPSCNVVITDPLGSVIPTLVSLVSNVVNFVQPDKSTSCPLSPVHPFNTSDSRLEHKLKSKLFYSDVTSVLTSPVQSSNVIAVTLGIYLNTESLLFVISELMLG